MDIIYVKKDDDKTLSYTYRIDENDSSLMKTGSVHFGIKGELTTETLSTSQKELIEAITDTSSKSKQAEQLEKEKEEILAILDLKPLPQRLPAQSGKRLPAPLEVSLPTTEVRSIPSGSLFGKMKRGLSLFARAITEEPSEVQKRVAAAKDGNENFVGSNNNLDL